MLLAHKIALDPNKAQRDYFSRASGVARFAYNWALAEWQRQYKEGGKPSDAALRRQLNAIKRDQFPWMFDVTKCAAQEAIIDLGAAYARAFENMRLKRRVGKKNPWGFPVFKKKDGRDSFCAANEVGTFRVEGHKIKLPVVGSVMMREEVRFSGPIKRATISRAANRWFVSLLIETDAARPSAHQQDTVGVDLGVRTLAMLSTGEAVKGPKAHKAALKRLRRANKALARKRRGSANFKKAKRRLARLHARITNVRKDVTHKLTTRLAKTYRVVGIEDLNVKGMVACRSLSRAVMDGGFFEFRRQLEYKARLYGSRVVVVDRWFPSSKTCSCCGVVKSTLARGAETFSCDACGHVIDRDLNAAVNLERLAASSAVTACGENRSGAKRKPRVKRSSVKQEENTALKDAA